MAFLNRVGNGASMTNSIDLVCNSVSIINPDGSLQPVSANNPVFTGTITGVDNVSVAQLALHQSEIDALATSTNTNTNSINNIKSTLTTNLISLNNLS